MTPDSLFSSYFTSDTMSVHMSVGSSIQRKKGNPGSWVLETLDKSMDEEEFSRMYTHITQDCLKQSGCYLEYASTSAFVYQLAQYRVVVTFPPLSTWPEMTIVRPITTRTLPDYVLPSQLQERLEHKAEGILIAGTPGNGKTTFAQALLAKYATEQKIIKTIEVPRDMRVPQGVTQYALSHSTLDELRNLLLLTRPDYTFFDEIRNPEDFRLYKDLRLTGIGMVGVIHAARPMDAVQRFLGHVDLGVLPEIVDTIIFINKGEVEHVYSTALTVKVPQGLQDPDLARPVLQVSDALTNSVVYEVYTFGDETVVMAVDGRSQITQQSGLHSLGVKELKRQLQKELSYPFELTMKGEHGAILILDDRDMASFIGKGGSHIKAMEQQLGLKLDVSSKSEAQQHLLGDEVLFDTRVGKKQAIFLIPRAPVQKGILVCDGKIHVEVWTDREGIISLDKKSPARKALQRGTVRLFKKSE